MLIERFSASEMPAIQELVAKVLFNKGVTLGTQGDGKGAIESYDVLIERFSASEMPAIQEQVAKALGAKGQTLGTQGDGKGAIECYDVLIERFSASEMPAIQELVAKALLLKGKVFSKKPDRDSAFKLFDQVINLDIEGGEWIKSVALVEKAMLSVGQNEESQRLIEEAVKLYPDIQGYIHGMLEPFAQGLDEILNSFSDAEKKKFEEVAATRGHRTQLFLGEASVFQQNKSLFFCLREWNSFTPAVPDWQEIDRGGGYFIRYKNQGIVIDPGYDFIENYAKIGGRICDINHIVVTHAHNDHTQDFESLMMLIHEFNVQHKKNKKKVHLYLSHGALRKFSGYLPLRSSDHVGRIEVMTQGRKEHPQVIALEGLKGAQLTVLRACHDDVLTLDYSVGLHFCFEFDDGTRTLLFTGDSGLYPVRLTERGEVNRNEKDDKILDLEPLNPDCTALYSFYPDSAKEPDLMIAHIGAVQKYELEKAKLDILMQEKEKRPLLFYPDHLGVRGTAILLDKVGPRAAIISEFGEELKDIRFSLARGINKYLERGKESPELRVLPGDLTLAYDIEARTFLCHQDGDFHPLNTLEFRETNEHRSSPFFSEAGMGQPIQRTYLFKDPALLDVDAYAMVKEYYKSWEENGGHPAWCVKWLP